MKLLLSYFVKYSDNSIIILIEYPSDCIIRELEKKLVIMIIYDESIFFAKEEQKRYKLLIVKVFNI